MTIPEILKELEPYTGKFPMKAMRAAIEQREAITPELLGDVRRAYTEGLVDETVADLEGIERDVAAPKPWRRERQHLITYAIAEMEWWASFHPEDSPPKRMPKVDAPVALPVPDLDSDYVAPQPYVREPKVGRNEPCPCGSGRSTRSAA